MTWYQVGIVFKELQEIGWRTNVFPKIIAVLGIQVGLTAHTRQSLKVWSLVESVFLTTIVTSTGTGPGIGTGQTAVSWARLLESRTVELSSCMNYKSLLIAMFVIVVMAPQVSCLVCFFGCVSQQPVIKHHQTGFTSIPQRCFSAISNLRWLLTLLDDNKAVCFQSDHNCYQFCYGIRTYRICRIIPYTHSYYYLETRYFLFLISQWKTRIVLSQSQQRLPRQFGAKHNFLVRKQ